VVVTTNEERDLPAAFIRRCVTHRLDHPAPLRLVEIARRHFDTAAEPMTDDDAALALALARRIDVLRADAAPGARKPSTAEFLDAFRACRAYGVTPNPDDATWQLVEQLTLAKPEAEPW
jgi:MoxR-like ATPase